jgi:beta-1,4-mannosyltransferase
MRVMAYPAYKTRALQPYNALLCSALEGCGVEVEEFSPLGLLRSRPDVWHVHWPERLLNHRWLPYGIARALGLLGLLVAARMWRIRVVWTIHNFAAHDAYHPRLERLFWAAFVPLVDAYVSLSSTVHRAAQERFPRLRRLPGAVVPLGHYRGEYPDTVSRAEARRRLGIAGDLPMALFVGGVHPYKNVPVLVRAFRALGGPGVLVVAGKPGASTAADDIRAAAGDDPRVRLELRFIPDEELQLFLRAADLTVLPYREIANSSSAVLSLSFDCPVLVPAKGALEDLQAEVGQEWVRTYEGELTPELLAAALHWARAGARPARAPLEGLDWGVLAAATVRLFRRAMGRHEVAQSAREEHARG